ncbi:hypothetical protein [Chlorogloeopsis fritschii]|uniref:hypothetical protein n=1 Tax=Chlorogloeopsis fritschii TaxID=1124 RepID=UPI0023F4A517|nr:hypothetical protein [Chlorogloeopsis fritschii]
MTGLNIQQVAARSPPPIAHLKVGEERFSAFHPIPSHEYPVPSPFYKNAIARWVQIAYERNTSAAIRDLKQSLS